jgi:ABC-type nitrate/sulfonate/bicarbonate transport system substrate-binding protein
LEKISITHFTPPSLGAFLSPIIKARKFDQKNGLEIDYHPLPPDAYISSFNSGQYQVSASAAAMTVGLANTRGVDIVNLFNVFDFWCAVVTSRPDIKTVKDLENHDIAAAKGTISYIMFEWLAKQQGADVSKIAVVNTATPGLIGYAMAERSAAVQLWEPAYTILKARKPSIVTLDLKLPESWKAFAHSSTIPYQGVAAHRKWVEEHPELVEKLFKTYQEAGEWLVAHPDEAAPIILPKGSAEEQQAISRLIRAKDRLGLNVMWARDMRNEIEALYKIGLDTGYLSKMPTSATIFDPSAKK